MDDLEVLVVDCQTTGSNPASGRLIEVGWGRGRARDPAWEVESLVVRLPRGKRLPPRVAELTGIRQEEVLAGLPPDEVLARLPAGRVAVAHYARFERAFLPPLRDWICTHELACRLLPGLPRRGLRAVAGYFGHLMPEQKRCAAHVRATIAVWTEFASRLRDLGVRSREDLRRWLEQVTPARRGGRDFPLPRATRLALPDAPGIYRLRARNGALLYLGKATSLRQRVNSYFQKRTGGEHGELLTQAFHVEVAVAPSPLEAALQEADEIKHHAPPYNTALRERGRGVWFAARDFGSVRPRPDARHPVGPLPGRDAVDCLRGLPDWHARGAALWRQETEDKEELAVRQAAHLVRRARWFVRLSEASLVWRPPRGSHCRILVLERGRIVRREEGEHAPVPPGWRRGRTERQRAFDAATYDRLRVLTTELRRLVSGTGRLELRLGPRRLLARPRLARILCWL